MQQQHKRLRAPPGMNPIPAPPAPWNEVLIQPGRSRKKQAILSSSSSSIGSASISDHLKQQQRKNKNVHFFPDPFFPHARAMRCGSSTAGNAAPPASCVLQATSASSNGSENWEQQCCARPAACRFRPDLSIEPDIMKNKKQAHHKRLHPTPSEEEQKHQGPDLAGDDGEEEGEEEEEEEDDSSSLTAEAIAAESLLALDVLAHCASVQAQIHDSAASGSTREVFLHGLGFSIFQRRIQRRARSAVANHHHQPQPQQERPYLLRSKTRTTPIDNSKSKSKSGSSNNLEDASVASPPIARSQQRKRARLLPSKFQDSVLMWSKKKKSSSRRERN